MDQLAISVGRDCLVGGSDTVVEINRASAVFGRGADRDVAVVRGDGLTKSVAGRGRCVSQGRRKYELGVKTGGKSLTATRAVAVLIPPKPSLTVNVTVSMPGAV